MMKLLKNELNFKAGLADMLCIFGRTKQTLSFTKKLILKKNHQSPHFLQIDIDVNLSINHLVAFSKLELLFGKTDQVQAILEHLSMQ